MRKKTQLKYESDSDSDSETESKKMIMKLIKKHSKMHGAGIFDDIGSYVTDKKGLASDVLQYGLPAAMGAVGAIGGPAGAVAGKEGGVLLSKKIAEDNGMSRRSQDPFDSNFLGQSDANKSKREMVYYNNDNNDGKPYDPLTKEERKYLNEHNRKLEQQERDRTLERYDYTDIKRGIIKGNAKRSKGEQELYDMFHSGIGMGILQETPERGIHIDVNSHNASGSKAKSGMGFFDDFAEDLRPVKHHGMPMKPIPKEMLHMGQGFSIDKMRFMDNQRYETKPAVPKFERDVPKFEREMNVGMGLRSRKKAKDHVSRRAFDEYIKNEMDRMARKDLAESRAVRGGKKAKPAGGYGYGLKGSPEMAEKMRKIRAMKKK